MADINKKTAKLHRRGKRESSNYGVLFKGGGGPRRGTSGLDLIGHPGDKIPTRGTTVAERLKVVTGYLKKDREAFREKRRAEKFGKD